MSIGCVLNVMKSLPLGRTVKRLKPYKKVLIPAAQHYLICFGAEDINSTYAYLISYLNSPTYDFRYRALGWTDWVTVGVGIKSRRKIEVLLPGTPYEYQVNFECGGRNDGLVGY